MGGGGEVVVGFRWSLAPVVLFASAAVGTAAGVYVWRLRGAVGRAGLTVVCLAASVWAVAHGFSLGATSHGARTAWGALQYLGTTTLPPGWLVFTLCYAGRERAVTRRLLALLAVEPVAMLALLAGPSTRALVLRYPDGTGKRAPAQVGPLYWPHFVYTNAVALIATGVLVIALVRTSRVYWRQSVVLLAAISLVFAANVASTLNLGPFRLVDPTPTAVALGAVVIVWGVFRHRLLDLVPVARTALVEVLPDPVIVLDPFGRIVDLNPAARRLLAAPATDVIGRPLNDVLPAAHGDSAGAWLDKLALAERHEVGLPVDGHEREFEVITSELRDARGAQAGRLLTMRDITDRKQAERRLEHLATHDPLTGLPNRALFVDRLELALAHARRTRLPLAVLFLDVDHLKQVNDALGHATGDALLAAVAGRVAACLRGEDTLARLGGDEFAIILAEIGHPDDAAVVADKALRAIAGGIVIAGIAIDASVSIGIAVWPDDGDDGERLLAAADAAMYVAKSRGRNQFVLARAPGGLASQT